MSKCAVGCCRNPYSQDEHGNRGTCWFKGRCWCHTDERDERARIRAVTQEFEEVS